MFDIAEGRSVKTGESVFTVYDGEDIFYGSQYGSFATMREALNKAAELEAMQNDK